MFEEIEKNMEKRTDEILETPKKEELSMQPQKQESKFRKILTNLFNSIKNWFYVKQDNTIERKLAAEQILKEKIIKEKQH